MLLECGVPEVSRFMVLGDEEARLGRERIAGEGEREGDAGFRTVRPLRFSLEEERLEVADSGFREGRRVGLRPGSPGPASRAPRDGRENRTKAPKLNRRGPCGGMSARAPTVMSSMKEPGNWMMRVSVPPGARFRGPARKP